jgi:transcriptional regulator with XRE-family HTH domain
MPRIVDETERAVNRFRDWVRGECRRRGITQRELSDDLLISEAALCKRLNGKTDMSLPEIVKICSVLGGYTFGGNEQ